MTDAVINWVSSEYGCLGLLVAIVATLWGAVAFRVAADAAGFDTSEWSGD